MALFGDVWRVLEERRGVLTESFRTSDGQDCTQSINKLERALLVEPNTFKRDIKVVGYVPHMHKVFRLKKGKSPCLPKP